MEVIAFSQHLNLKLKRTYTSRWIRTVAGILLDGWLIVGAFQKHSLTRLQTKNHLI